MKSFLMLAALVVALAYASVTMAESLPPVPKTATATVTAIIVPKTEAVKVEKVEKVEPAPLPSALKVTEKTEAACEAAPMPPIPCSGKVDATTHKCKCECKKCSRKPVEKSVVFVTNELLRKPIYDVEKALWESEGRRLNRENTRLSEEAEELTAKSAKLAEKIKATDKSDLHAKLVLIKQERAYATQANNLAVRRAALELKQAEHAEQGKKLDSKHVKLYHNAG
jgi:hypothetical protein